MDVARPALLVSLLLAALTLVYSGRWAGMDPRAAQPANAVQLADVDTGSTAR
jgi:hypothetical protein